MELFLKIICVFLTIGQTPNDILWKETFDYPDGELPEIYWSEGCKATIKEGRLVVDADTIGHRCSTIWLDKEFSGNISVEFDAYIISSKDFANNINFFFMYSDPSGQHLRQSAPKRKTADYGFYHDLNGYIFTNVSNDGSKLNARYRMRSNPGFKLVKEVNIGKSKIGETIHIKITKKNNRIQYWADNQKILDVTADKTAPVHERGLMGFRIWHTSVWLDNLIVKRM